MTLVLDRAKALTIARKVRAGRLSVEQAADAMVAWAEAGPASAERMRADIVYHLVSGLCPTVTALARACGIGYQDAYRHVQALEEMGAVRASSAGIEIRSLFAPIAAVGATCWHTRTPLCDIRALCRKANIAAARHRVCWIATEVCGSPAAVARVIERDRTTVLNSLARHQPTDEDRDIVARIRGS